MKEFRRINVRELKVDWPDVSILELKNLRELGVLRAELKRKRIIGGNVATMESAKASTAEIQEYLASYQTTLMEVDEFIPPKLERFFQSILEGMSYSQL